MFDPESDRYGSGRFAGFYDIARAKLFRRKGVHAGFFNGIAMAHDNDAHGLIVGGAGSGKGRSLIIPMHLHDMGGHRWTLDPKAEIVATTMVNALRRRAHLYCFNPCGLFTDLGVPQHRINLLEILDPAHPRFDADCKFIVEALVVLSGNPGSRYFELRARDVIECVMKALVEHHGRHRLTLPMLYDALCAIMSGPQHWQDLFQIMATSRFAEARRMAHELDTKQLDAPKEFSAIMGTVQEHMQFLSDRLLREALGAADFSFAEFNQSDHLVEFFSACPMEYLGIWAAVNRLAFTVLMLYRARVTGAPPVTITVDEAAQLGHFEALPRAIATMRGYGARIIPVFQDIGQITRHYGPTGLQAFFGGAQWRHLLGIRDIETARLVSAMLGNQTLEFDNEVQQREARRKWQEAARRFMDDGDPMASAFDFDAYGFAAQARSKMQRPLMTPDEVLALPEDRMISFVSGRNVPPIYARRRNYDAVRALRGRWLPNPYHPPHDRVKLPGLFGSRRIDVVNEAVPEHLAHFPQFQCGFVRYVRGYRPW